MSVRGDTINDLERKVQRYLYNISKEIKKARSDNRLFELYCELSRLKVVIETNDLNVKIPLLVDYYYDYDYDFSDKVYSKMYKEFIMNENEMRLIDKKIGIVGNKLFEKYGLRDYCGKDKPISFKEAIDLSLKFFDYYDLHMLKHLKMLIEKDLIHRCSLIEDGDTSGFTATLTSQRENLIIVHDKRSLTLPCTIIHETFHSYVESFLYDIKHEQRIRRYTNNLDEVITNFSEQMFIKFLEEINYNRQSIKFLKKINVDFLIYILNEFSEKQFLSPKETIDNFMEYKNFEGCVYGSLLSYHFLNKYENSSNVKDDILNFSLDVKDYHKKQMLNSYGLSSEEITDSEKIDKILSKHLN